MENIQIDLPSSTQLYHCSFSILALEYKSKPIDNIKYKEENWKRDEEEFINPEKEKDFAVFQLFRRGIPGNVR